MKNRKCFQCEKVDVRKVGIGLLAIYAGYSLCYLLNLMTGGKVFTQSLLSAGLFAVVFGCLFWFGQELYKMEDVAFRKRRLRYVWSTGFLLGLAFVMGYQMRMQGMTSVGVKGKLWILLVSAGIGIGVSPFVNIWFHLLDKAVSRKTEAVFGKSGRCFLASWGVMMVCWIPVFLAYFPANMSYDFNRQSIEAVQGYLWFNTHHPLIHTFLIRCALKLGEAVGSYQAGMAVFSGVQMLILSAVMAYSCVMAGRLTHKKWPVVVTTLFFGLLPIHPVMGMSMTKDVLFAAFFLLLLLLILERKLYRDTHAVKGTRMLGLNAAIVAVGIAMILFRNNAVYAFAVFAVFYVWWSRRERLQILLLCVLILAGGQGAKGAMQKAMNARSGSEMEKYSVFIQQMCRVAVNQGGNLSDEDWWTINTYVPCDYWEDYNPTIADSIKANVANTAFLNWRDDIPGMLRDWFQLGLKYPNDYLDAFLALTSGYWFPDDVSHAEVLGYGEDTERGLIYTFNASASGVFDGIENHSYLPGVLESYQRIINGNSYYDWPVLSNLFKPAFYCWLLLLVMISAGYLRKRQKAVLCMLPFWNLMTLFLGPVVNFRYAYPIIIAIPFLLAWMFGPTEWNKEDAAKNEAVLEKI